MVTALPAVTYYFQALEQNPFLPKAFNNMVVICHYRGEQAIRQGNYDVTEAWFDQVTEYWKQDIALTLSNYIEAHNWLKIMRRLE